jgi:hypothetical protein
MREHFNHACAYAVYFHGLLNIKQDEIINDVQARRDVTRTGPATIHD